MWAAKLRVTFKDGEKIGRKELEAIRRNAKGKTPDEIPSSPLALDSPRWIDNGEKNKASERSRSSSADE